MSLTTNIPIDWQNALVNHLWQSTVLVLLTWVLTLNLRRYRASLRYSLWFLASVKFAVPLAILIALGKALRPVVESTSNIQVPRISGFAVRSMQPDAIPVHALPQAMVHHAPTVSVAVMIWLVCFSVWALGSLILIALWLRDWVKLNGIARKSQPLGDVEGIPILLCVNAIDAGVFGILKPVILLPEILAHELSSSELESVYAHELCHIRRRDNLLAAIHNLIHVIFWFHPAVWFIRARLMDERESACDEWVLASGIDTDTYARSILNVCKVHIEAPSSVIAGVTGGKLKERIQRISSHISMETLGSGRKFVLALAAMSVLLLPIILGLTNAMAVQAGSTFTSAINSEWDVGTPPTAKESLKFDVTSVRPSKEGEPGSNVPLGPGNVYTPSHGILSAKNQTLLTYLVFAYKLADYQQEAIRSSAPDWVLHDRYTIEARTEKSDATKDELRLMMRALLAERFKLAAHYEKREVRVFALVTVKEGSLGSKLRSHPAGAACAGASLKSTTADGQTRDLPLQPEKGSFPAVCSGILGLPASAQDRYSFGASNVSMSLIASALSSWGNLGRPVVDQTGLNGNYDFVMDYTPDPRPSYATVDSDGPSFMEALREQLGLRLEGRSAPVEFLALDHVEHPDPN
jgi:bla regulator protein BlaR1